MAKRLHPTLKDIRVGQTVYVAWLEINFNCPQQRWCFRRVPVVAESQLTEDDRDPAMKRFALTPDDFRHLVKRVNSEGGFDTFKVFYSARRARSFLNLVSSGTYVED